MGKSRVEYENLIRNSILFSLDRNTQATTYRREALKLVEYLYLYLVAINADKYTEFGLEITETANRCIKNYTADAGDFLNYFNSAISKEYRKAYARKQLAEQHGGVHIPENDQRVIRKYIKFAEHSGTYEITEEMINTISDSTGISYEKVADCISDYNNSFATGASYTTNDGSEGSLLDMIPSEKTTEDELTEKNAAAEFIKQIDEVFSARQARQKPLLSKLLTAKLAEEILDDDYLLEVARLQSFFDEDIYVASCNRETPITAREIAESLGLSEQSVSRSYKMFIALL